MNTLAPVDTEHQKFLHYLENSVGAVQTVAKMLCGRGYTVTMPTLRKAPVRAQWKKYSDNGDLFVRREFDDGRVIEGRVEVKQLTAVFTGAHDWPFPDFMVCNTYSFDRANPKPIWYIILAKSGRYAARVPVAATVSLWEAQTRRDRRFIDHVQDFYFCPIDKVIFFDMPE